MQSAWADSFALSLSLSLNRTRPSQRLLVAHLFVFSFHLTTPNTSPRSPTHIYITDIIYIYVHSLCWYMFCLDLPSSIGSVPICVMALGLGYDTIMLFRYWFIQSRIPTSYCNPQRSTHNKAVESFVILWHIKMTHGSDVSMFVLQFGPATRCCIHCKIFIYV